MYLELSTEQGEALADQLDQDLGQLSHEIAVATDTTRTGELNARLSVLSDVTKILRRLLTSRTNAPDELFRELAQPGD